MTRQFELDWDRSGRTTKDPGISEDLHYILIDDIDKLMNLFYFTDEQMEGYGEGHPIITDDCPALEFSSAKTIILGRDPSFVLSDIDSFLAVKNE